MNKKNLKSDFSFPTRASARTGLLVILALVVGLAVGGVWYWRLSKSHVEESVEAATPGVVLSQTTTRILAGLDTTINLSLFAPADVSALPATLNGFVTRVESLLAEYERVAAGKLRVTKCDPQSDAAAKAAAGVAGIVPFASENGEIVYLGLTVGNGARIESISPLAPEWETALEPDVTRAIQRVSAKNVVKSQVVDRSPTQPLPIDPAISEELLRMFPNLASQSFDDAAKILRESALAEFTAAVRAMQLKVQETEKQLAAAQGNKSEAEQQAAMKQLRAVQDVETKKLDEITSRLQTRIKVLERLKTVERAPGK
ncbi:MAG: hypothetical protein HOP33_04365 [Verrucomicrobia bacterium]|nr:hypothetical protein [Verrucomicrobiota bacterium]